MISLSSVMLTLFFYGLGGWFFYHNVVKTIPERIRAKRMVYRIIKPNVKELNNDIKTYADVIKKIPDGESNSIVRNFLYLKLLSKDIYLLTDILKREKNEDKKNILSRTLASLLYEFYNDINNLYDRNFQKEVQLILSVEMVNTLKSIKKMTGIAATQYFEKLKLIRMNVGSHRDFDVAKQNTIINSIDCDEIMIISNYALFMIYFFNIYHVSFTAKVLQKLNLKIPDIPFFNNAREDLKIWQVYADYIKDKSN